MPDSNPFSFVFHWPCQCLQNLVNHLSKYFFKYISNFLFSLGRSCSSKSNHFKPPSKSSTSKNIRQWTGPCVLIIAETCRRCGTQYYEEVQSMKGASRLAKTRELKYRKSIEPASQPLPLPPPNAWRVAKTQELEYCKSVEPAPAFASAQRRRRR